MALQFNDEPKINNSNTINSDESINFNMNNQARQNNRAPSENSFLDELTSFRAQSGAQLSTDPSTNKIYNEFRTLLDPLKHNQNYTDLEFTVHEIPKSVKVALPYSAVVLTAAIKNSSQKYLYALTIIVEASNSNSNERNTTIPDPNGRGNITISQFIPASQSFYSAVSNIDSSNLLKTAINERVLINKYTDYKIVYLAPITAPRAWTNEGLDNNKILSLFNFAQYALFTRIGLKYEIRKIKPETLQGFLKTPTTITISKQKTDIHDIFDNPTSNRLSILQSITPARLPNAYDNAAEARAILGVTGFMEAIFEQQQYDTPTVQLMNGSYISPARRTFSPRYVITDLMEDPEVRYAYGDYGAMLMSFALSLMLAGNSKRWIHGFWPDTTTDNDPNYIGALNYFAKVELLQQNVPNLTTPGEVFNLNKSGFDKQAFLDFIQTIFHTDTGFKIAIDIPYGSQNSSFLEICNASIYSDEAYNILHDSLNNLTNGMFAQYYPKNRTQNPIFLSFDEKVYVGYFIDKEGVKKPLSDITLSTVINAFYEKDPELISMYASSFSPRLDENIRLSNRKKVIDALTKSRAVYTDIAQRRTLSSAALKVFFDCVYNGWNAKDIIVPFDFTNTGYDFAFDLGIGSGLNINGLNANYAQRQYNNFQGFSNNNPYGNSW